MTGDHQEELAISSPKEGLWQKIKDSLSRVFSGGPSPTHHSSGDTYQPRPDLIERGGWKQISVRKVARRLGLERRGRGNGENELPRTDSNVPDAPQEEIIQQLHSITSKEHAACEDRLIEKSSILQLKQKRIDENAEIVRSAGRDLELKFRELVEQRLPDIRDADEDLHHREREVKDFQAAHKVSRNPEIHENQSLLYGTAGLILLAEALVNSYFFAKGSGEGFLGGAVTAFILAAVDIAIVISLGRAIAWFASGQAIWRIAASAALIVFIAWAVFYNILTAHVREALLFVPDDFQKVALQSFLEHPFANIQEAKSYYLVVLGMAFSVGGVFTGIEWTDKIPGFAKLGIKLRYAKEDFDEMHNDFLVTLGNIENAFRGKVEQATREMKQLLIEMKHQIDSKEVLARNFPRFVAHYEKTHNALIRTYQDANAKARETPPPAYFNQNFPVEEKFTSLTDTSLSDKKEYQIYKAKVEDVADNEQKIRGSFHSAYEKAVKEYNSIRKDEFQSERGKRP